MNDEILKDLQSQLPEGWEIVRQGDWIPADRLRQAEVDRKIEVALAKEGALSVRAAKALLNLEGAEGWDEKEVNAQIQALRRDNGFLFCDQQAASGIHFSQRPAPDPNELSDEEYYTMKKNGII